MIFKRFFIIASIAGWIITGSATAQVADPIVADTLNAPASDTTVQTQDQPVVHVVRASVAEEPVSDTTRPKVHSPRKATLYSMALPGLGQIYNRKYWKLPIIYAGIGGLVYMGVQNTSEYKRWHDAYLYKVKKETGGNELADKYDASQLKSQSDYYRRNVELTYILGSLLYILNMVDAAVDAHLFNYDISDDLSFRLDQKPLPADPAISFDNSVMPPVQGITLTWRF